MGFNPHTTWTGRYFVESLNLGGAWTDIGYVYPLVSCEILFTHQLTSLCGACLRYHSFTNIIY